MNGHLAKVSLTTCWDQMNWQRDERRDDVENTRVKPFALAVQDEYKALTMLIKEAWAFKSNTLKNVVS